MASAQDYFISIGSNVEPQVYIPRALRELRSLMGSLDTSPVYETPPEGPSGEKPFWNLAVRVRTSLSRSQAEQLLREIEDRNGRNRSQDKFAPRTLDLDLLPRPGYQKQSFVMIPLADLDPGRIDEETGQTYQALADGHAAKAKLFKTVTLVGMV